MNLETNELFSGELEDKENALTDHTISQPNKSRC